MKTSLIIPTYYANDEIREMTANCIDSLKYGMPDEVLLIEDEHGDGYTKTTNRGLAQATGDILIIGNNDIIFTPGWLEGILKPLEMGYDISSIVTSDQGTETRDEITEWDRFGSLFALKRKVYETLGPLDESLGTGYFSDPDYYLRAKAAGFKIAKNWNALVEHLGGVSFNATGKRQEQFEDSMAKFKAKWHMVI